MTISKTPRHDYRLGGRFAKQHPPADAFPDSALQEAARIQRAMSTDMPPMPEPPLGGEPVERQLWWDFADWWMDVRGVVLCAAFVLTVLAFGSHFAGLWGQ